MADPPAAIVTHSLTTTFPDSTPGLVDITLALPAGSRTLLLGANGSGKTTLLRLLSGRRLSPPNTILIHATDPFSSTPTGLTYLGLEWSLNPAIRADICVSELLASVGGDRWPSRRDELVELLDIDVRWRMHAVSDGERRRVQLAMGLVRPWRVLLLDEVTVDLDGLMRRRLLNWVRGETEGEARGTVVHATHILDGLEGWATHLVHMAQGRVKEWGAMQKFLAAPKQELGDLMAAGEGALTALMLGWLVQDLKERGPRGPRPGEDRGDNREGGVKAAVLSAEGKTYEDFSGRGGYGNLKAPPRGQQ
ncbi:MAG: CCR4-NOT regulatory complex component [Trizodia sp. TS-e1964]|nr:MAG: CCR4-NOT regulatory complex component [Trizodia sp. TS-e1964]